MDKGKRSQDDGHDGERRRQKGPDGSMLTDNDGEPENIIDGLVFEDPFEDEFEEEVLDDQEGEIDGDEEDGEGAADVAAAAAESTTSIGKQVWRPGVDNIGEGEALEYDPSAYIMYHSLQTEWPCLSFDVVKDTLGESRQRVWHHGI
jgi:ribosome assembly protein RRB1